MDSITRKNDLRISLMDILSNLTDKLDERQVLTYSGLQHLGKVMYDEDSPTDKDINYSLNLCIEILTEVEADGLLSETQKEEFDNICQIVIGLEELESLGIERGSMVISDGYPYIVGDIDYDEPSVNLWTGDEGDYRFWVSPSDVKKSVK